MISRYSMTPDDITQLNDAQKQALLFGLTCENNIRANHPLYWL
ncbi:hypothetical protein PUN28_015847 [Cardiocondyla obscurior]|uniref:Uncharacterized protein n=1 Tax=Cardiocondyla obscurior TaxID=286306 RepID=A0AAW2EUE3_9HYME